MGCPVPGIRHILGLGYSDLSLSGIIIGRMGKQEN